MEEHGAAGATQMFRLDLEAGPDSEWCPVLVSPEVLGVVGGIAARTGETPDQVIVRAIRELDERTRT